MGKAGMAGTSMGTAGIGKASEAGMGRSVPTMATLLGSWSSPTPRYGRGLMRAPVFGGSKKRRGVGDNSSAIEQPIISGLPRTWRKCRPK